MQLKGEHVVLGRTGQSRTGQGGRSDWKETVSTDRKMPAVKAR